MLAEYLATEQAREDVGRMVDTMKTAIGSRCRGAVEGLWVDGSHDGVWVRVGYWDPEEDTVLCFAYYRPDGDRFIVTDLGEGVRALRLRTGAKYIDILQKCRRTQRADHFYGVFGQIYDATIGAGNWERGSGIGALFDASTEADRADLPDAICRVMLASLRVAWVGL